MSTSAVEMPATTTLIGGGLGFCMQMYINALRKLPVLRSASPEPLSPVCEASRDARSGSDPDLGFAPRREPGAPRGVILVRARACASSAVARAPARKPRRRDPTGERAERTSCALAKKSAEATTDPPRPLLPSTDPWQHVFWTGAGAGFANWNAEWEAKLRKEVDAMNAERQATNARFMESIVKGESK